MAAQRTELRRQEDRAASEAVTGSPGDFRASQSIKTPDGNDRALEADVVCRITFRRGCGYEILQQRSGIQNMLLNPSTYEAVGLMRGAISSRRV